MAQSPQKPGNDQESGLLPPGGGPPGPIILHALRAHLDTIDTKLKELQESSSQMRAKLDGLPKE